MYYEKFWKIMQGTEKETLIHCITQQIRQIFITKDTTLLQSLIHIPAICTNVYENIGTALDQYAFKASFNIIPWQNGTEDRHHTHEYYMISTLMLYYNRYFKTWVTKAWILYTLLQRGREFSLSPSCWNLHVDLVATITWQTIGSYIPLCSLPWTQLNTALCLLVYHSGTHKWSK